MRDRHYARIVIVGIIVSTCLVLLTLWVGRAKGQVAATIPISHLGGSSGSELSASTSSTEPERLPATSSASAGKELEARSVKEKEVGISGIVIDDLERPVDSFSIRWNPILTIEDADRRARDAFQGRLTRQFASEFGQFSWSGLGAVSGLLVASDAFGNTSLPVPYSHTSTARVVLVIPRSGWIHGRVVINGAAAVGAIVRVDNAHGSQPFDHEAGEKYTIGESGPAGSFVVNNIPVGAKRIMAFSGDAAESVWKDVIVRPGEGSYVEIALEPGGYIRGTIDHSCGNLNGRTVALYSFRGTHGWQEAISGESGEFEFREVVPQAYIIELRSSADDGQQLRQRVNVERGRTTSVHFSEDALSIPVNGVVRRGGLPVENVKVRILPVNGIGYDASATVDSQGRFVTQVDHCGYYQFTFNARIGVHVTQKRMVDGGAGVLTFELDGGGVYGTVLSPSGVPAPNIPLTLMRSPVEAQESGHGAYFRAMSNGEGRYSFDLLPPGKYELRAPDGGWSDSPAITTPYGSAQRELVFVKEMPVMMNLVLRPETRILCTVMDREGYGVRGASVQAESLDGVRVYGGWGPLTDGRGVCELRNLAPGTYRVIARKDERVVTSDWLVLGPGAIKSANVTIR